MAEPAAEAPLRVYHLEELRRNLFRAAAAVIAVIGLGYGLFAFWLLGGPAGGLNVLDWLFIAVPPLGFWAGAAAVVWAAESIRLELAVDGVTLRIPGASVAARWEDVASLGLAPWGVLTGESLILRRPARVKSSLPFHFVAPEIMSAAIPLAPFALPVRGSRLEADLASRLPQLFEDEGRGVTALLRRSE